MRINQQNTFQHALFQLTHFLGTFQKVNHPIIAPSQTHLTMDFSIDALLKSRCILLVYVVPINSFKSSSTHTYVVSSSLSSRCDSFGVLQALGTYISYIAHQTNSASNSSGVKHFPYCWFQQRLVRCVGLGFQIQQQQHNIGVRSSSGQDFGSCNKSLSNNDC